MKNILEQPKAAPRMKTRAAPMLDKDERFEDKDRKKGIISNIPYPRRAFINRAAPYPNFDAYKYSSTRSDLTTFESWKLLGDTSEVQGGTNLKKEATYLA